MLGIFASYILSIYIIKPYHKKKSKLYNLIQFILEIGLLNCLIYIFKKITHYILNNISFFENLDCTNKEYHSSALISLACFIYIGRRIQEKIYHLFKK